MKDFLEFLIVGFIGFGLVLAFLPIVSIGIAKASGWKRLASKYGHKQPIEGRRYNWQSAIFTYQATYNKHPYASILQFIQGKNGIFISIIFIFRFGHSNIYIPWSKISLKPKKIGLKKYISLIVDINEGENVTISISETLAKDLELFKHTLRNE